MRPACGRPLTFRHTNPILLTIQVRLWPAWTECRLRFPGVPTQPLSRRSLAHTSSLLYLFRALFLLPLFAPLPGPSQQYVVCPCLGARSGRQRCRDAVDASGSRGHGRGGDGGAPWLWVRLKAETRPARHWGTGESNQQDETKRATENDKGGTKRATEGRQGRNEEGDRGATGAERRG